MKPEVWYLVFVNKYFKSLIQYIAGTSNSKLPTLKRKEQQHNLASFQSCCSGFASHLQKSC